MLLPTWAAVIIAGSAAAGGVTVATLVVTTSGPFAGTDAPRAPEPAASQEAAPTQPIPSSLETITGGPDSKGPPQDGPPGTAQFGSPAGVAAGRNGEIYVADFNNHVVVRIDSSGVSTRIAGSGAQGVKDGAAFEAEFFGPQDLAIGSDGTIYVADGYGNRVRKIDSDGRVTTVAGGGDFGLGKGEFRDGRGSAARFDGVSGIDVTPSGDLVVADYTNQRIRVVTSDGIVTTLAGTGTYGRQDGPAQQATFAHPSALAVGPDGTIWITEHGNNDVRAIAPDRTVRTVLQPTAPFSPQASVSYPSGVAVSPGGLVYVADTQGHRIILLEPDGSARPVAGSGIPGFSNGLGSLAALHSPAGLAVDQAGALILADRDNAAIRKVFVP